MNLFRPMTTAGAPGSGAPMTSKSPADKCARYHKDGICASRCGSLARSGLPVAVSVPSTSQLLEPRAEPRDGKSVEDAKAVLQRLSTTEERRKGGFSPCLRFLVASVVASFFVVIHRRSSSPRIVSAVGGYGGNNCAARSGPM